MEQFINKICNIRVKPANSSKQLYYTGTILSITPSHIGFIDKLGKLCYYHVDEVKEITSTA